MRLPFSLQQGEGEMPSDFASRLATRACRDSLWDFCADFGLDAQGIIDGDLEAVSALGRFAGVEPDGLMREAFVKQGSNHRYRHKGTDVSRRNMTRDRLRVCPDCLTEDVEGRSYRMAARPHRRSVWIIGAIHTCSRHQRALVDLRVGARSGRSHETSIGLAQALPRLDRLHSQAASRPPSAFETYVEKRLDGKPGSPWLDTLPFYAALDMVRVVGAVAVHGPKVKLESLDDEQTRASETAGFDILRQGENGVCVLLDDLQVKFRGGRAAWGPKAMFGRLYEWLAHETDDAAHEPMRQIMMDHVHRNLPVGPGETMFGRDFGSRRVHSIHSAALEFAHHPKRLRKLLLGAELIGRETNGLTDERVLFDAEEGATLIREINEALKFGEAARYLNIPRPQDRRILVDAGFFEPLVQGDASKKLKGDLFRRGDLDAWLRNLTRDAEPVESETDLVQIQAAAKRSCCEVLAIVRLILARKLRRVGLLQGETGFMSVLVSVAEIRPMVIAPDHGGLKLRDVEKELKTTTGVVKYLVDEGLIRSTRLPNRVHKGMQTVVSPEDIERFRAEFATLHNLAVSRGVHVLTMRKELDAAGVRPVAEDAEVKLTLYRIAEVP